MHQPGENLLLIPPGKLLVSFCKSKCNTCAVGVVWQQIHKYQIITKLYQEFKKKENIKINLVQPNGCAYICN